MLDTSNPKHNAPIKEYSLDLNCLNCLSAYYLSIFKYMD